MADFSPAFAHDGELREPTSDEIETGFGCGAANLPLFNWMFYAIWAEIGEVMTSNGITPSNLDFTQLRQAIQNQIDASTGGGSADQFLLLDQAAARLPIFPEVQNDNGHFGVVSPGAGQIRVPSGVSFLHRGISPYTTVQEDLATDTSKTYHLRWNKTDGFALKDLASGGYNPGTLSESDPTFDSTFDDMLVARIITNSSNVPTITNLVNRQNMSITKILAGTNAKDVGANGSRADFVDYYNWARKPTSLALSVAGVNMPVDPGDHDFSISMYQPSANLNNFNSTVVMNYNRYQVAQTVLYDFATSISMFLSARA